jgi:hypothetical protein
MQVKIITQVSWQVTNPSKMCVPYLETAATNKNYFYEKNYEQ